MSFVLDPIDESMPLAEKPVRHSELMGFFFLSPYCSTVFQLLFYTFYSFVLQSCP